MFECTRSGGLFGVAAVAALAFGGNAQRVDAAAGAEGLRVLLLDGTPTMHLVWAPLLCVALIAILIPIDLRILRRRVLGEE